LTIDKIKVELAYLRRMKYGRSSERLEQPQPQLELVGGQAATVDGVPSSQAEPGGDDGQQSNVSSLEKARAKRQSKPRPGLREMPEHLPRRTVVHRPLGGCDCQACGAGLREISQDVSEVLDYEPGTFHVVRHVRPKLACAGCHTITQALAPSRPADRCMAGAGLLTHILVNKFADHTPLYRLCQIFGREEIELARSTITDWVGQAGWLLTPLAQAVGRYVLKAAKIHGDDTPIRSLGGKGKKAHTGRLWVYVRDDRPSGDQAPPAVWFQYSASRKGHSQCLADPEYAYSFVHLQMNPYMATKKTGPTLAALNAQIAKLEAQAEALRTKEVAGVVARIREAIVHYGLTATDLGLSSAKSRAPKGAAAVATSIAKRKAVGKSPARAIKYTDGKGGGLERYRQAPEMVQGCARGWQ